MIHIFRRCLVLALLAFSAPGNAQPLLCQVSGSDDLFILYSDKQIWESPDHRVYAWMNGLTIAVVNKRTLKFNRLTSLNLLAPPDRKQFFEGQCRDGAFNPDDASRL